MSRAGVIGRILSLLIALAYAVYVLIRILPHATNAAQTTLVCLEMGALITVPVIFIWFPEPIGSVTGFLGTNMVNAETPPILISIAGWIMLLALPFLAHYLAAADLHPFGPPPLSSPLPAPSSQNPCQAT